ncbi:Protein FAM32A like protein [Argiope bruennichi]|uniref:Protein FAM32A like protein n=1 Tax=Argiope bruennichi TaxID=94029 RepID=A0A8T0EWS2_ARGBR|nr:Protein FAM32A like protein [Argiope bruennichi]
MWKKKNKEKKILETLAKVEKTTGAENTQEEKPQTVPLTKAERAFLLMKEKKQMERILEKASKTHKQRVEEFNHHLDSLTEHYDIPKVSWTK